MACGFELPAGGEKDNQRRKKRESREPVDVQVSSWICTGEGRMKKDMGEHSRPYLVHRAETKSPEG